MNKIKAKPYQCTVPPKWIKTGLEFMSDEDESCDVLIIGGGIAGCGPSQGFGSKRRELDTNRERRFSYGTTTATPQDNPRRLTVS